MYSLRVKGGFPTPASSSRLLALTGDLSAAGTGGTVSSTNTELTLGEALPDLTLVGTVGESLVGVQDGITGLDEVGVARHPGT